MACFVLFFFQERRFIMALRNTDVYIFAFSNWNSFSFAELQNYFVIKKDELGEKMFGHSGNLHFSLENK